MAMNIFRAGAQGFDDTERMIDTIRRKRASYRAAPKLARRDYAGAAQEYGQMGLDAEAAEMGAEAGRMDEQQKAEALRKGQLLVKAVQSLTTVPMGQRKQALSHPLFQSIGITPDLTANLTEEQLSDDSLRAFVGQVEEQVEFIKSGDGSYTAASQRTGKPLYQYQAPQRPEYRTVGEGQSLVEIPGSPGASMPQSDDWLGEVARAAPDAQVTSGYRDPARNARVGGKPNSRHLTGEAVDLVPRPGETVAQLHARLSRVPGVKAINEGDHVHVQRTGQAQPGARVIAQGAPRPPERWVDLPGGGQMNTATGKKDGVPKASGRLSSTVVKMQNDLLQDLQAASSVNTVIDRTINQIDRGQLNLGPVTNLVSQGRNLVGASDANSRNFGAFRATLEKMRNDSLRLNKGVQTEGDAQRAWNELLANINDERLVRQRLEEIRDLNEQAIALRSDLVNQARADSGMGPLDTTRFRARPAKNDPGQAQARPRVGEVRKGYRYKGGDPASPSSWVKVQ